jgi:dihydropteroate synthase
VTPDTQRALRCRGRVLTLGQHTLVMGILNVTPDSFSDGGSHQSRADAVAHACRMADEGADIIDIGGESTRPGYTPVSTEEEIDRTAEVVAGVCARVGVTISIDTHKATVARAALEAGASIVNDVWGLQADPAMAGLCAEFGAPVVVMHNRTELARTDVMNDVLAFLRQSIRLATEAGIARDQVIVDPGLGFGKTFEQNMSLLAHLADLRTLGQPILLGASRKSFIGRVLDLPASERVEGTVATSVMGMMAGADIVRVHDVEPNVRALKMAEAIMAARGTMGK